MQNANTTLACTLTPFDRDRLDELAAYFAAVNPDIPVPQPEEIVRIAIDELHRLRLRDAMFPMFPMFRAA